ncbi:hypothetical protein QYE76_035391 [Lolium multiflorum]|uniref:Uncharacterized protein n=1 Tax=Lolium multiflorum TaxID=4521 RepID=A0AAD8VP60_LOLMU|nr:hypothetical protein QYE76_035391 [Lolium multiflorum]
MSTPPALLPRARWSPAGAARHPSRWAAADGSKATGDVDAVPSASTDAWMCADWRITASRWRMSLSVALAASPAAASATRALLNAPEMDF